MRAEVEIAEAMTAGLPAAPPVFRSFETAPLPVNAQHFSVVYCDGQAFQRFSRKMAREVWVAVAEPHENGYGQRERVAFAIAVPDLQQGQRLVRKLERSVTRFNRDLEKVHALASGKPTRWEQRLYRVQGWIKRVYA